MTESGIKFKCEWIKSPPFDEAMIYELIGYRQRLYSLGLVGVDNDGVGYGNLSTRKAGVTFFVTGAKTGEIPKITNEHISLVENFDIPRDTLQCKGPIIASSESLTHAALYSVDPKIAAVIHVHNKKIWEMYLNKLPTSSKNIPYGTPDMAAEVKRLYKTELKDIKVVIMGGHEDGVIAFGESLEEAFNAIVGLTQ